jgi:excisionase family DNA binding protein
MPCGDGIPPGNQSQLNLKKSTAKGTSEAPANPSGHQYKQALKLFGKILQTTISSKILTEESPELMTVKETAEYLRIPLPTAYHLVQRGQLPAIQIGRRWRVKRSLLDRDVLEDAGPAQPTVLVVDDDATLQSLFKQLLKKAGFSGMGVGSGEEAISYAEKQKLDLIFLNLQLPDMPGDEVYLRLKELHPDLPIVIITGYPDSVMLNKILQSGHVTLIKKRLTWEELDRALRQLGHKGLPMAG